MSESAIHNLCLAIWLGAIIGLLFGVNVKLARIADAVEASATHKPQGETE